MIDRTTVFMKPAQGRTETGFGLPSDLLEKSRRRVRIVAYLALLGSGIDLVFMVVDLLFHLTPDARTDLSGILPIFANLATVTAALAMIAFASNRSIRSRRLLEMALVFEVFLCFVISVSNPLSFYGEHGTLPQLTWVTPLIILFPLIVPCPPGRTLVTAVVSALMRPLGIFILAATGKIDVGLSAYFVAAFNPTLAVVFAVFGSRVIYGLGVEVAEARRMGNYELERLLGKGGMGEVWLAHHRMLARPAAVKLVRPELLGATDSDRDLLLQRFEREAQATASLRSPHTISLYDYGIADDGTFFYVMELLDGFDADTLVRRFGAVPVGRAVHLLQQICHSLAEAHEAGLVHRDIKPANIYVCRYGRDLDFVKVLDFGLVRRTAEADTELTAEHVITGTPAFMAPEQIVERDQGDAQSDIYAVGCVAYWLLTGRLVFEGKTPMEVLTHHARTAPEAPSHRTEAPIPDSLDRLVLECLAKDPGKRPAGALALSARLSECTVPHWDRSAALQWWLDHATARAHQPTKNS